MFWSLFGMLVFGMLSKRGPAGFWSQSTLDRIWIDFEGSGRVLGILETNPKPRQNGLKIGIFKNVAVPSLLRFWFLVSGRVLEGLGTQILNFGILLLSLELLVFVLLLLLFLLVWIRAFRSCLGATGLEELGISRARLIAIFFNLRAADTFFIVFLSYSTKVASFKITVLGNLK